MDTLPVFLARLVPALPPIPPRQIIRIFVGALIGIGLTGLLTSLLVPGSLLPFLIPPLGASAVLLFGVPASPLAQPWSIIGGNMISAAVGVTVAMLVPDVIVASALAVSLAIVAMIVCKCLHPPGGAMALTAVLGPPAIHAAGYHFVLMPCGLNSLLLLVAALLYNNLTGHRYPHALPVAKPVTHRTEDPPPTQRAGILRPDLEAALAQYDEILDIAPEDLEAILLQLQAKTFTRRSGGIRVEHIMSRDVVAVPPGATLDAALQAMNRHNIRDLPVTEPTGHLRGIFTQSDLMRALSEGGRNELTHPVADYMTPSVETARALQPIAELVPAMADRGLHAMPVTDEEGRLIGMLTQSDLIAGLFARRAVLESA